MEILRTNCNLLEKKELILIEQNSEVSQINKNLKAEIDELSLLNS